MNELPKVERTTLTMKETAEYLGISYWLVNRLVRRKQIPCARVGGRVLFRVQALNEYLTEKEENSIKKQKGVPYMQWIKVFTDIFANSKCNYY